ncbi:hypothetical protein T484DRAFT_1855743, partial [Baffinella frigidus]
MHQGLLVELQKRDSELERLHSDKMSQKHSEEQLRGDVEHQLNQLHSAFEEERNARRE